MQITITAKPVFNFVISNNELTILLGLSENHYDAKCKSISKSGGFLFGWQNMMLSDNGFTWKEETTVAATFDQLDILLKVLEGSWCLSPEDKPIASKMSITFRHALQVSNTIMPTLSWGV